LIAAYKTLIVDLAQGLGSNETAAALGTAADAIINLEIELAKISLSDEDRYDTEMVYHPFKLNDFQAVTDALDPSFKVNNGLLINTQIGF
jgi:predicted metalloendopeptidase